MDKQREQFLQKRTEDVLRSCQQPEKMRQLIRTIIKRGGEFVILPLVIFKEGEPCHCHSNTANLYESNRDNSRCCTGYALSDDGTWRQHSWLLFNGMIVETTVPRIKYFGYVMTRKESDQFSSSNY